MDVQRLRWSDHNESKLAAHGIARREVVEVLDVDAWVPATDDRYPNQVRIIGPTVSGRFLTLVLEETEEAGLWRPVTGWDSTPTEREYHRDEWR
jgi:hypothetical protein